MTKKPAIPLERRQMEAALQLYQKCKGWQATDEALDSLARSFPGFDFKSTLLKAAAVNALYGTQVYDVGEVAEHVYNILGNTPLSATPALVEELAKVKFVRGSKHITWTFRSFASKFAHFFIDPDHEIAFYQKQIEQKEAAMADILAGIDIAGNLLSIPGIGLVTVAGFLGEIGDPQNYEHWKQIQKLAGLNLSEQSSGQKNGQSKISKRGRAELRNLLYQASLTLVAKNREFKTLYHYFLTKRENPLKKKQALIAIAVKLLRVMYGLARKKENYDSDKVLGDYRRAQLQQAA